MQTLHSLQTWYIIETHKHNTTLSTWIVNIRIHENFSTIYTSFNNSQMIDKTAQNSLKWKGPTGLLFFFMHTTRKYGADCGDQYLAVFGVQKTFNWHKSCTTTRTPSQQFKENEAKKNIWKIAKSHFVVHAHTLSLLANITSLATFLSDMAKSIYQVIFRDCPTLGTKIQRP